MKNPGFIDANSALHKALVAYAKEVAKEFEIAVAPAIGQLFKLHDAMCKAADSEEKMSNLIIGNHSESRDEIS